jgi:hypothetical protein
MPTIRVKTCGMVDWRCAHCITNHNSASVRCKAILVQGYETTVVVPAGLLFGTSN